MAHEGDLYRTRLTHSLEVSQVARSIARELGLDEDLAETLALCHDLGHPPFGHAGEDELNDCMESFKGFDHNAQTLRVVTTLEQVYPRFDGLNLTWETLEGLVKHNGPLIDEGQSIDGLPQAFKDYPQLEQLDLHTFAGPEAQVAALADDIAYNNHDIDDGIASGLFTIQDIQVVPLVGEVFSAVQEDYPHLDDRRLVAEAVRRLIGLWINDLVAETRRRLKKHAPKSADDIRNLDEPVVAFSEELDAKQSVLRAFLYERMYKHYKVNRMRSKARRLLRDLFTLFHKEPNTLPTPLREMAEQAPADRRARLVCDYIAGMTDDFAIDEHRRLFDLDTMVRAND